MTSISVVSLVSELEQRYEIEISAEDLSRNHFQIENILFFYFEIGQSSKIWCVLYITYLVEIRMEVIMGKERTKKNWDKYV